MWRWSWVGLGFILSSIMTCSFFCLPLQVFEPERWMIAEKVCRPFSRTAFHYFIPNPPRDLIFFFFFFYIHSEVYPNSVMYLHTVLFPHFYFVFSSVKLLPVINEVMRPILVKGSIYCIFNTHLLGSSVLLFFFFFCSRTVFLLLKKERERTKVLLLVFSAFSSKTFLKAHASLRS